MQRSPVAQYPTHAYLAFLALVMAAAAVNSREIILPGKSIGTTNLIVWDKSGVATMMDVSITPESPPPAPKPVPENRESVEVIKGLNKSNMEF